MPKYSIVLPTLNGRETLAIVLPAMLGQIGRPDIQWIVSDNCSDDGCYDWLLQLAAADRRLRVVRPPHRLRIGEHLEFAYRFAEGRWLCHIGDDDLLLPERFEILDRVIDQTGADIISGRFLRYLWPGYPDPTVANSLDPNQHFGDQVSLLTGAEFARRMLNDKNIYPGGSWSIRRDVVERVRRRAGWFSSPQHLEFFGMRSAACLSRRAAVVDAPLFVLGRHAKSSCSLAYLPIRWLGSRRWDWNFEDPQPYRHCPFPWKAYCTLSLDAALSVKETFPEALAGVEIDWRHWTDLIFREAAELVRIGQLPQSVINDFQRAVARLPMASPRYWRWRWTRKSLERPWRLWKEISRPWRRAVRRAPSGFQHSATGYGWTDRIYGGTMGFTSIVEAADWFAANRPAAKKHARAA